MIYISKKSIIKNKLVFLQDLIKFAEKTKNIGYASDFYNKLFKFIYQIDDIDIFNLIVNITGLKFELLQVIDDIQSEDIALKIVSVINETDIEIETVSKYLSCVILTC
jgi:hypothetical protein